MRQGYIEILENAAQEAEYVADFVIELSQVSETRKLWRSWSGILDHYVKAVSALRRATDQGKSKSWSDELKYQQKADSILQYAFQSRDHASHVFEGKREVSQRFVSLGGLISVGGNANVTMLNNTVIDHNGHVSKLPNGMLQTEDGRYASGTIPRGAVEEHAHFVILSTVNTRSGIWHVPNPETKPEFQALEIGQYLSKWLEIKIAEAKEMAKLEKH